MYEQFGVPLSYAGIISMIISAAPLYRAFVGQTHKKIRRGLVTAVSTLLTALAFSDFPFPAHTFPFAFWLFHGLGAGAIDAALNNYVALHYASAMSWLHCFWGVGAAISPYIMGYSLSKDLNWSLGYRIVSIIQICFTAVLFISLPLWRKNRENGHTTENSRPLTLKEAVSIKGVKLVLAAFFSYCALEWTACLWASSYLVEYRQIDANTAARFASLLFIGITVGRFLCGFIADKVGDKNLIRIGTAVTMFGIVLVALPLKVDSIALAGLIIIGFGCAPIYPSIIHSTPVNFGKENSQAIVGIQMASAYVGSTFMPPVFGMLADNISMGLYPFYLMFFGVLMVIMSERLNKTVAKA